MAWNLFGGRPEPSWPEALGEAGGEDAPCVFLLFESGLADRHQRTLRALQCALLQRGMEEVEGRADRWQGGLRAAFTEPVASGKHLLVLAGHRVDELAEGLRLEAGLPLVPGANAALELGRKRGGGLEVFRVGLPGRWRQLIRAEQEQIEEATAALDSKDAARTTAAASTLARLEFFDRGPWVELAVVCWEQAGYAADLALASLCLHELRWLRVARDPLAERVVAFLWALSDNNWSVEAIARRCGPRVDLGVHPQTLAEEVPTELAAAACGVPTRQRRHWRGAASFEAMLQAQSDPRMRAVVALKAVQGILPRYISGWNPARLSQLRLLAMQATDEFGPEHHPKMRALAMASLADIEGAAGDEAKADGLRRQALRLLRLPDGRFRDEGLAKQLKGRLV